MSKIVSAEFAASLVQDGMTVGVGGFYGSCVPEELLIALQERYRNTQSPKNLTVFHSAGIGDSAERGANHLGEEGLVEKLIGAHLGLAPRIGKLIMENKIRAYMVPQGVTAQILRATAGKKPGVITHVGLKTFADPRLEGCKANQATIDSGEEIVSLINIEGKEYLFYKAVPLDICFIKGTYADEMGNISLEEESVISDQLEMATATHNSGGIVVVQVNKVVAKNSLNARNVVIHGFMVDYVVVGKPENNVQTFDCDHYRFEIAGLIKIPISDIEPWPLTERKVCGRRAAMELKKGNLVNLGVGVPEAVAAVAGEEGISDKFTFSVESGPLGGVPLGGKGMGASYNFEALYKQSDTFDLYDGGGLDFGCLGAAEIDEKGNVNVSKFAGRAVGPGGFINISQNAKTVCFLGSFTAGGLKVQIQDGKCKILQEGRNIKFLKQVEQVTFSGDYARETGQQVFYITERAVFKLLPEGLTLIEIAPGIDLEKDILANMQFKPIIAKDLKLMDERIFREEKMGLTL